MSSVYFYELITKHTKAQCDQDHIDIILSSRATTPDRTDYILNKSCENPLIRMEEDIRMLEKMGATVIAIPCNTAHYFYDKLSECVSIPVLNIIRETVLYLKETGIKRAGILATEGTLFSNAYPQISEKYDLTCISPSKESQQLLMDIIYGSIKCGKAVDTNAFAKVSNELLDKGCEKLILGCTELSLLKKDGLTDNLYVDSMEVLAYKAIRFCGKEAQGLLSDWKTKEEFHL